MISLDSSDTDDVSERRKRTLWLGNVESNWAASDVYNLFKKDVMEENKPNIIIKCNARKGWKNKEGKRVGFALIEFKTIDDANNIMQLYNGKIVTMSNNNFVLQLKPNSYSHHACDEDSNAHNNESDMRVVDDANNNHSERMNAIDRIIKHIVQDTDGSNAYIDDTNQNQPSLEDQLEALSITQLRDRINRYGVCTRDVEQEGQMTGGRIGKKKALISILCTMYRINSSRYPRIYKYAFDSGYKLSDHDVGPLLILLRNLSWPKRKRNVNASEYLVLGLGAAGGSSKYTSLQLPDEEGKQKMHPKLLQKYHVQLQYHSLWSVASKLLQKFIPTTHFNHTSIAITKNFRKSPHVDMNDRTFQFAVSLGDFEEGGDLCVEDESGEIVHVVRTKHRLVCVDGRYPHWVTDYKGERYSVIFYRVEGAVEPRRQPLYDVCNFE